MSEERGCATGSHTDKNRTDSHYVDGGRKKSAFARVSIKQGLPAPVDLIAAYEMSSYGNRAYSRALPNALSGLCQEWSFL